MAVLDAFRLDDQVALVTGAARGLGWEMAQAFAEAGALTVLHGRTAEAVEPRATELARRGLAADTIGFDMADVPAVERTMDALLARHGRVDILLNNVGERDRRSVQRIEPEDFDRLIAVDLGAVYRLIKRVMPGMIERRHGRVICVTSIVDQLAANGSPSYTAAKGGLAALTRALAAELGRHGITCNAIAPGFFATETNTAMTQGESGAQRARRVPLSRWAEPREIAGAALLLASPAGSYINGHTLVVDGGISATYDML
ncbi:MAG: SDR family oxidoreductase [Alphaproteobacteria bacterium]|nr:SDR family oxidoreductase [Alphaproteobacteria bacterium]MCW5742080.1 SDR family oxidoreductase [Alphaproteobacteria bacterium]